MSFEQTATETSRSWELSPQCRITLHCREQVTSMLENFDPESGLWEPSPGSIVKHVSWEDGLQWVQTELRLGVTRAPLPAATG